jgi:hypothetical protein
MRGANVEFSDNLHMKVYWSTKGCLISSANLSFNALGSNPLKEIGILLTSNSVNIKRIIQIVKPYPVTESKLRKLTRQSRKSTDPKRKNTREQRDTFDFSQWHSSAYRNSDDWLLGWWEDSMLEDAKNAKERAKKEYGVKEVSGSINFSKGQIRNGDFLLCFQIDGSQITNIDWMYVDFAVKVSPSDKSAYEKSYPYQAVQVNDLKYYNPPFKITPSFRKAFAMALIKFGLNKITARTSLKCPKIILDNTFKFMKEDKKL